MGRSAYNLFQGTIPEFVHTDTITAVNPVGQSGPPLPFEYKSDIRGPFAEFVDSPFYSESNCVEVW